MSRKPEGDRAGETISLRVGKKFKTEYDTYIKNNNFIASDVARDALTYWISQDGKPENYKTLLDQSNTQIDLLKEIIIEKEKLLEEKERTIQLLHQLNQAKRQSDLSLQSTTAILAEKKESYNHPISRK